MYFIQINTICGFMFTLFIIVNEELPILCELQPTNRALLRRCRYLVFRPPEPLLISNILMKLKTEFEVQRYNCRARTNALFNKNAEV